MSPLIVFEVSSSSQLFNGHFDVVHSSIGNGWFTNHNSFVVPVKGLYYFSTTLNVLSNQKASVHFPISGIPQCKFYHSVKPLLQ